MGWPQITIIAVSAVGIGIHAAKHGQPRDGKYSLWIALIAAASEMYILKVGGFFA